MRKTYKRTVALDGLSFTVPAGKVTGFLGPNGAGKTTTFRSLLGLTKPDAGPCRSSAWMSGRAFQTSFLTWGRSSKSPGSSKGLNGRDNLRVAAHTLGRGHEKIDELLAFAGLTADAGRRIDGYSKGMRQRLALAASLLGDPELLFLDEPLDGLDPAGQAQIKASLRQLAADGRTIVVSSHNLGDVEAMADEVIVINHGRLVTQSSLQEILGVQTAGHLVEVDDPVRAVEVLAAAGVTASITDGRVVAEAENGSDISRILAGAGLYPSALYKQSGRLEEVFLRLTSADQ